MLKIDELLAQGKFEEVVTLQSRKVKWLFNNSNKYTSVVDEKIVRLLVHKLRERKELEERTERNMNVISDFVEHVKSESGFFIPESVILSFFNA